MGRGGPCWTDGLKQTGGPTEVGGKRKMGNGFGLPGRIEFRLR
jgi:hypothetical protein